MDHPSIMKFLEDDEDESMHSGADVEALSAALKNDIGGDSSQPPQSSDSVGVLPQASSSASQQLLEQWKTSSESENNDQNMQSKEESPPPPHSHSSEQHPSQIESTQHVSDTKDQNKPSSNQPKHDELKLQSETTLPQSVEKDQVNTPGQSSLQFPKQEGSSLQQNAHQQFNIQQQSTAANEANNAAKRMKASSSIPFQLLIPIIRPHLDKDRSMQLQSVFNKLRNNEVSKEDFLRVIRNIVGDQMLRQAVNKVHMQIQSQSARNPQNPTQYSLQTQASPQQLISHENQMFPDPRAFSSLNNPMSSSQNQKGPSEPPRHPKSASTVQMQMDAMFPPVDNSGQKSRGIESKNTVNVEKESSMGSFQAINKQQQHSLRPQPSSFSIYGGNSANLPAHPYARPPITATSSSLRSQTPHAQGMVSTQLGSSHSGNVMNTPKFEMQNIANEAMRIHGGPGPSTTSHLTPQQLPVSWQSMANKEQRNSIPSMPHVKQEVVDQISEPPHKLQLVTPDDQGIPTVRSLNNDGTEKQSSKTGLPTSLRNIGSSANLVDSSAQITTKIQPKKPSAGQKKPLEAVTNSSTVASKKQKTAGAFHEQSIEQLNDVTAVSGVNLREEEEQLLSAHKEDNRASEATRRVVQEEEEKLILQKGPLQKKLADIMFKCGLKRISSDVERCLSMCVEERLLGLISSLIRLSKQRVDVEKSRHRFVITSDIHREILAVNTKAKEEWDKKQAEEAEKNRKVNENEGSTGSDADKDKDESRSKASKVNKEEDDKMRTTAANVAARAAVGGDDMLSKWQLMAEQARQKREGLDGSPSGKATKPSFRRNLRDQQESLKEGFSSALGSGGNQKFGRNPSLMPQPRVAHNITRKDVIAVLEREPQMSKSTLIYRLYEKIPSETTVEKLDKAQN